MTRKPSYKELEHQNKLLKEALVATTSTKKLKTVHTPDKQTLEQAYFKGYQIGATNTMLMATSMVGIEVYSALINRAGWRMSDKDMIAEIEELTPKLAALVTQWRNDAVKSNISEDRINYVLVIASDIQDAAKAAIQGDGGAAIRALFPDKELSRAFPHEGDQLMPERYYIGKKAVEMRKLRKYKKHGGWVNIGLDLIEELEQRDLTNEPTAKSALAWLQSFQHDRKQLSNRIAEAHNDYSKLRFP